MEEDAGEEEIEEELAPVMVQLAYVAAQTGKHAEAMESYEASFPGFLFFCFCVASGGPYFSCFFLCCKNMSLA